MHQYFILHSYLQSSNFLIRTSSMSYFNTWPCNLKYDMPTLLNHIYQTIFCISDHSYITQTHFVPPSPLSYLSIFFRSMHSLQISNNHPPYKRLKSYINCLLATMWPNLLRTRTWITIFKYFFLISILLSSAFLRRQQKFAQSFLWFCQNHKE